MKHTAAFTMLEIVVMLGIVAAVAVLLLPVTVNQLRGEKVGAAAANMTSNIYLLQQNAYTRKNNTAYGVRFTTNTYYLFAGTSYAAATDIETIVIGDGITLTNINLTGGATEMVFLAGSFRPNVAGTVTMTDGLVSYRFEINAEGLLFATKL